MFGRRPSRWALAHILVVYFFVVISSGFFDFCTVLVKRLAEKSISERPILCRVGCETLAQYPRVTADVLQLNHSRVYSALAA